MPMAQSDEGLGALSRFPEEMSPLDLMLLGVTPRVANSNLM